MLLDAIEALLLSLSLALCKYSTNGALLKCDFCDITQPLKLDIISPERLSLVSKLLKHKLHIYIFTLNALLSHAISQSAPTVNIDQTFGYKKKSFNRCTFNAIYSSQLTPPCRALPNRQMYMCNEWKCRVFVYLHFSSFFIVHCEALDISRFIKPNPNAVNRIGA